MTRPATLAACLLLIAPLGATLPAQEPAGDTPEPGTRAAIAAATTEPRFLSPWVADLPQSATVPSPTKHLGHIVGAPGELTRTEKIYGYYRALAAATDRVKVDVIGKTEEGRDILLVFVGDAASLRDLERYRSDAAALADPRQTDEAAMERIVARTKPFYMLHGGLHSPETGSPEMLMELAYRLAVSDAPHIQLIRDNHRQVRFYALPHLRILRHDRDRTGGLGPIDIQRRAWSWSFDKLRMRTIYRAGQSKTSS